MNKVMIVFESFILSIDSVYLWGVLALFLIFFIIFSSILRFHWDKYSPKNNSKFFVKSLFWTVSFLLIIISTLSLLTLELIN